MKLAVILRNALRLSAVALGLLTMLAIILGRQNSLDEVQNSIRQPAHPRYRVYDGLLFSRYQHNLRIADLLTSQITILKFKTSDYFSHTSCSPWTDSRGQYHLLSRWQDIGDDRSAEKLAANVVRMPRKFGLSRWTYPEGKVLDRIELTPSPFGPVCWSPSTSDLILYVAADGLIYRYSLPRSRDSEGVRSSTIEQPRAVTWADHTIGRRRLFLKDLNWPIDLSLKGFLIASLVDRESSEGLESLPHLWWLKLDDCNSSVLTAGRLEMEGEIEDGVTPVEERFPRISSDPEGRLWLAYVIRARGQTQCSLKVVQLRCGADQNSLIRLGRGYEQAVGSAFTPPDFSPDGRAVYAMILNKESSASHLEKFPIESQPLTRGEVGCE